LLNAYLVEPCYHFKSYMKQKHNNFLDGTLTITHEALMAFAKLHFDYLKTTGQWGAKSLDNKKIAAMVGEINALKGQLKLDPKLSTIAKDNKKKDDKGDNKKVRKRRTRRILPTRGSKRRTRNGRRCHPRTATQRKSKWADLPSSGASTTWHGQPTSLRTAG
jgi:hypothetical protein